MKKGIATVCSILFEVARKIYDCMAFQVTTLTVFTQLLELENFMATESITKVSMTYAKTIENISGYCQRSLCLVH